MIKDQIVQWWNDNKENPDLVKIQEYVGFLYQEQQDAIKDWMSINIAKEKLQYLANIKDPKSFTDNKFDDFCTQAKLDANEKGLLSKVISVIRENSVITLDNWSRKVPLTYNLAKYKLGEKIGDITKRSFDYYQNPQANFGCSEENLKYACSLLECSPTDTDLYNYCDSLNLQGVKCKSDINQRRLYWQILWCSLEINKRKKKSGYSIWKVSEGWWKDHKKLDSAEQLRKQSYVTVADDTPSKGRATKTQWEYFRDAPKGDVCYLCYGNTQIVAIGVFVTENYEEFDGIWKKRKVEWIFDAIKAGSYQGEKKWWTPNDNSTFIQIPSNEHSQFEKLILTPFFNKSLSELTEERNRIMENACSMSNNKQMINDIKNLLENNHNIILHGAPGTGKTYLAKEIAKVMGAEYEMVQFHQSYDYTDFVEGLRPAKDSDGNVAGFDRQDGVFKSFCKNALEIVGEDSIEQYSADDVEKMVEWFKQEVQKNVSGIEIQSIRSEVKFFVKSFNGTLKIVTSNGSKIHPYYTAIKRYLKTKVYNHSNMTYTPAIGQYILDKYPRNTELKPKIIQAKDAKFVFIIDEINRGEMSKIFGELFYSIDPGYRGENGRINTQYQNLVGEDDVFADGFFVPENVYIIGTMNDIDRSVESMDFAMRRRFAFKEISAEDSMSMLDNPESWKNAKGESVDVRSELAHIKNRMLNLNDEILKEEFNLGSSYQIGAAYFLKFAKYFDGANATSAFNNLWDYHLEGVLREYLRGMSDVDGLLEKLKTAYDVQDYVLKEKKSESTEG